MRTKGREYKNTPSGDFQKVPQGWNTAGCGLVGVRVRLIKDEAGSSLLKLDNNFESEVKRYEFHYHGKFLSRRLSRPELHFMPHVKFTLITIFYTSNFIIVYIVWRTLFKKKKKPTHNNIILSLREICVQFILPPQIIYTPGMFRLGRIVRNR